MNNLFDFIIAGEKLKLDKLVSSAVTLASKCKSKLLKQHMRYNEISEVTKNKITERRMTLLEEKGTKCDVFLDRLFWSFHFKHIANIACHSLLSITLDVYKLINFIFILFNKKLNEFYQSVLINWISSFKIVQFFRLVLNGWFDIIHSMKFKGQKRACMLVQSSF